MTPLRYVVLFTVVTILGGCPGGADAPDLGDPSAKCDFKPVNGSWKVHQHQTGGNCSTPDTDTITDLSDDPAVDKYCVTKTKKIGQCTTSVRINCPLRVDITGDPVAPGDPDFENIQTTKGAASDHQFTAATVTIDSNTKMHGTLEVQTEFAGDTCDDQFSVTYTQL